MIALTLEVIKEHTLITTFEEFINEVVKRLNDKKLIVFCGAGISYNSGVPLVNQIKRNIIQRFCKTADETELLVHDKIPFELFMQTLIEHSESEKLLDIFDIGEPNENHYLFARFAKAGILNCIITTNFDTHIEKAFATEKIKYKVHYDEAEFTNIELSNDFVTIIKIHGSVENKQRMAVTLKRVSGKILYSKRKDAINKIATGLNGNAILIMGYSCSDYFDINPILEGIDENKNEIFFLQHEKVEQQTFLVSPINSLTGNNPFKNYPGYLLNINTDIFVQNLVKQMYGDDLKIDKGKDIKWERLIDVWMNEVKIIKGRAIEAFIAGQLFNVCTRYAKAIEYFEDALNIANEDNDTELKINSLFALGRCYRDTQKNKEGWQKALFYLFKSNKLSKINKRLKKQCFSLLSIGVTMEDKKDHFKAIKYYEDAKKIAVRITEKDIEAICLGNIGIVMKNLAEEIPICSKYYFNKAIQFQKKSIDISVETGDKGSEGRTYGNIGIIASCMGDSLQAIKNYEIAFKIAKELNDYKHQGIWLFNKGFDLKNINLINAQVEIINAKNIFSGIEPPLENYIALCNKELEEIERLIT